VEISPTANPPVCRIVDYQKFVYQQKKKLKEQKAKSVKVVVKEIRFGPQTDDHDYNFKLKHAMNFLSEGAKVKAFVFFKGRTILSKNKAKFFCCALQTIWKIMQRLNKCLFSKVNVCQLCWLRKRAPRLQKKTKTRRKRPKLTNELRFFQNKTKAECIFGFFIGKILSRFGNRNKIVFFAHFFVWGRKIN
jgi:hypothetical protein